MNNPDHNPEQKLSDEIVFHGSEVAAELLDSKSVEVEKDDLLKPIPENAGKFAAEGIWKTVEVKDNGEPLVPLGAFSDHRHIFTSSVYFGEHSNSPYMMGADRIDGSLTTIFVRQGVAEMLTHAQQLLPERHYLIVMDAYRTLDVQQSLYDHYIDNLRTQHPDWTEDQLSSETQEYVSLPAPAPDRPWVSPHNSGGAVDLAIIRLPEDVDARVKEIDTAMDKLDDPDSDEGYVLEMEKLMLIRQYAEFLEFGTAFDHGGEKAALAYFEGKDELTPVEIEARNNRRMLYNAMTAAGFEPYGAEWWHFNSPKSQMGASIAGLPTAEYGVSDYSAENQGHEEIREAHYNGVVKIQEALMSGKPLTPRRLLGDPKYDQDVHYIELNKQVLQKTGDFRLTHLPDAEKISPEAA